MRVSHRVGIDIIGRGSFNLQHERLRWLNVQRERLRWFNIEHEMIRLFDLQHERLG